MVPCNEGEESIVMRGGIRQKTEIDRQTDRQTDGRTDGRTNGRSGASPRGFNLWRRHESVPPPPNHPSIRTWVSKTRQLPPLVIIIAAAACCLPPSGPFCTGEPARWVGRYSNVGHWVRPSIRPSRFQTMYTYLLDYLVATGPVAN